MHNIIIHLLYKLHYPTAKHIRVLVLVSIYSIDNRGETEEDDRKIKEMGVAGQDATGIGGNGKARNRRKLLSGRIVRCGVDS